MSKNIVEKYKLPKRVLVKIQRVPEGGFYATFPEIPGCHTQAASVVQLADNITDAILTYFDVPRKEIDETLLYIPEARKLESIEAAKVLSATTNVEAYRRCAVTC